MKHKNNMCKLVRVLSLTYFIISFARNYELRFEGILIFNIWYWYIHDSTWAFFRMLPEKIGAYGIYFFDYNVNFEIF